MLSIFLALVLTVSLGTGALAEAEAVPETEVTAEAEAAPETQATAEPLPPVETAVPEGEAAPAPETEAEPEAKATGEPLLPAETAEPAEETVPAPELTGEPADVPAPADMPVPAAATVNVKILEGRDAIKSDSLSGDTAMVGSFLSFELMKDYALTVVSGGAAGTPEYSCNDQTGEITALYTVAVNGPGDLELRITAETCPVKAIPITFAEGEDKVENSGRYVLPGGIFRVYCLDGYEAEAVKGAYASTSIVYYDYQTFTAYPDAEEIVLRIVPAEEEPAPGDCELVIEDASGGRAVISAKDADGSMRTVRSGERLPVGTSLVADVPVGFSIGGEADIYMLESEGVIRGQVADYDEDGRCMVYIRKDLALHIQDSGNGLIKASSYGASLNSKNKETLDREDTIDAFSMLQFVLRGDYELTAVGAGLPSLEISEFDYECDQEGNVTRTYALAPDGSADITVTIRRSSEPAPQAATIEYTDDYDAIEEMYRAPAVYALPGEDVVLNLKPGYRLDVQGGTCYMKNGFSVDSGATRVTVTVVPLRDEAVLQVKDGKNADALVAGFGTNHSGTVAGGILPGGTGNLLLKNGYRITAIEGGRYFDTFDTDIQYLHSTQGGEVYIQYTIFADSDTVTVSIEKTDPARWVNVKVVNNVGGGIIVYAPTEYNPFDREDYVLLKPDNELTFIVEDGYSAEVTGAEILRRAPGMAVSVFSGMTYVVAVDKDKSEVTITVRDDKGNIDGEGTQPDSKDVQALFQAVLAGSTDTVKCDMTGDHKVDLKDVTKLYQFVNGHIGTLD